jgi:hypothetical protein
VPLAEPLVGAAPEVLEAVVQAGGLLEEAVGLVRHEALVRAGQVEAG